MRKGDSKKRKLKGDGTFKNGNCVKINIIMQIIRKLKNVYNI